MGTLPIYLILFIHLRDQEITVDSQESDENGDILRNGQQM